MKGSLSSALKRMQTVYLCGNIEHVTLVTVRVQDTPLKLLANFYELRLRKNELPSGSIPYSYGLRLSRIALYKNAD